MISAHDEVTELRYHQKYNNVYSSTTTVTLHATSVFDTESQSNQ